MSLIPRDKLFDFDHPFNQFFKGFPAMQEADDFFAPRVEVRDNDAKYVITAELPGVDKDDLHVTLENGTLTIEGSTEDEEARHYLALARGSQRALEGSVTVDSPDGYVRAVFADPNGTRLGLWSQQA